VQRELFDQRVAQFRIIVNNQDRSRIGHVPRPRANTAVLMPDQAGAKSPRSDRACQQRIFAL
jgi:hypothetical protein